MANTRASTAKAGQVEGVLRRIGCGGRWRCPISGAYGSGTLPRANRWLRARPKASAIVWSSPLPAGHGPEQVGAIGFPLLGELLQPTPLPLSPIGRAVAHGLAARWGCHCLGLAWWSQDWTHLHGLRCPRMGTIQPRPREWCPRCLAGT